ncbi:hypothetical protein Ancab_021601 [Ancistrocladus abbreviatus]
MGKVTASIPVHSEWSYVNGLLMVYNVQRDILLCNPSLRLGLQLPSPPNRAMFVGLGFHSSSNDYKVVALIPVAPPFLDRLSAKSVFVKGAIHWMGYNKRSDNQILSFHVSSEVFSCIDLPQYGGSDNHAKPLQRWVFALRDSLALVDGFLRQGFVSIWAMEKYGLA